MEIHRTILTDLKKWKERDDRMPLVLTGARQVGKTWVLKEFGRREFKTTVYFNFETDKDLAGEFTRTKNPERLIDILRMYSKVEILPQQTLIILDEIQESNEALNSLKYFAEEAPEYCITAAGSLLGVSLSTGQSFPVGKVQFLEMYPVCFREYAMCCIPEACRWLDGMDRIEQLPLRVESLMEDAFRQYRICGGMPKAAIAMLEHKSLEVVDEILEDILRSYALDFAKHAPTPEIPRIDAVWQSIPSQLARENRKFLYKLVRTGARAREYEDALLWLIHAGLIYRIYCITRPGLPLSAYDDLSAFKIYLSDSGLLRVMSGLPTELFQNNSPIYREFKGALTENQILQALIPQFSPQPRYWTSSGTAEIDFITQYGLQVIPMEVKAADNASSKSLSVYIGKYEPETAIVYSTKPLQYDGKVLHIPLWMADWTRRLLEILSGS